MSLDKLQQLASSQYKPRLLAARLLHHLLGARSDRTPSLRHVWQALLLIRALELACEVLPLLLSKSVLHPAVSALSSCPQQLLIKQLRLAPPCILCRLTPACLSAL